MAARVLLAPFGYTPLWLSKLVSEEAIVASTRLSEKKRSNTFFVPILLEFLPSLRIANMVGGYLTENTSALTQLQELGVFISTPSAASSTSIALIDLRDREMFQQESTGGHLEGCYCIPLREFGKHGFETPPRHVHIVFFSPLGEVAKCQRFLTLHARLFPSYSLLEYSKDLWRYAASKGILEFGPSPPGRLLFPMNPLLDQEIERIESSQGGAGMALDIGCGSGRDVVRLLCRGWTVFGIDNMQKALDRCQDLATRQGC